MGLVTQGEKQHCRVVVIKVGFDGSGSEIVLGKIENSMVVGMKVALIDYGNEIWSEKIHRSVAAVTDSCGGSAGGGR